MKKLYIAEKPSVAVEFSKVLGIRAPKRNGYIESEDSIITWCVGHLITMSYPEAYDESLKRWSLSTLPFLPKEFKYQVIEGVRTQFNTVKELLNRDDVDSIYICTDSGREGEYIYRLVADASGVKNKKHYRVWIDSQTEEEIRRGIKEAKDWSEYDNLSASAYLRAKEDYLMGINFSRLLTLKYGNSIAGFLGLKRAVLSIGRVMTCVVGMVVRREREIRDFIKTPFYKLLGSFLFEDICLDGEWRALEKSKWHNSPGLYKENGFKTKEDAETLLRDLEAYAKENFAVVDNVIKKKEIKNPPLLYNLAELQNDCSKKFKLSPDNTLKIVQELYEKKLLTYPRTDARVLSGAIAKDIIKNLSGIKSFAHFSEYADYIVRVGTYKNIIKSKYVNDAQITDHYAIIPTGQGMKIYDTLPKIHRDIFDLVTRRFLSIFYPPAKYNKYTLDIMLDSEHFISNFKFCTDKGFLSLYEVDINAEDIKDSEKESEEKEILNNDFINIISNLKKGQELKLSKLEIKEGETSPPKRYTSGSMILAMENAGQLIEDEELRSQIKGSGIGTSATRAEILKKLINIKYIELNNKTQVITPTLFGEMVYEVVDSSIKQLLNPELTASWEKGLNYVANGDISSKEYMEKLERFVAKKTYAVLNLNNQYKLREAYDKISSNYKLKKTKR